MEIYAEACEARKDQCIPGRCMCFGNERFGMEVSMNSETGYAPRNAEEKREAKYTAKDSVFTDLFSHPKYLFQLYRALHPEDQETTEKSIRIVTMKNILLDQSYNDLGFQIGKRLLMLVEAQSGWTVNIILRSLLYLAQTWQEYIQSTGQNIYGSRRLELPRPELYVLYTGERKTRPKLLRLSDEFFAGRESAVEVRVKMIYDGKKGDIVSQYVAFTRIYNEQVRLYGRTRETVLKTIRICKNRNVLKEYLESREKEVVSMMMTLFDDEYILKTYIESERREAAEAAAEEAAEEAKRNARRIAGRLYQKGNAAADIADILDVAPEEVEEWLKSIR